MAHQKNYFDANLIVRGSGDSWRFLPVTYFCYPGSLLAISSPLGNIIQFHIGHPFSFYIVTLEVDLSPSRVYTIYSSLVSYVTW